jgi:hypothetical protein
MNKTGKTLIGIVVVIALLFGIRVALTLSGGQDDRKLIQQSLAEAIKASREGRPGGVVELLSANLKLNETEVGANQRQITDFIRKQKPSVTVTDPTPQITGEEARIVSPVELDLGILGKRNLSEVTLIFRKEDSTEFLLIPTRKWRLTEVRAPETAIAELMAGSY